MMTDGALNYLQGRTMLFWFQVSKHSRIQTLGIVDMIKSVWAGWPNDMLERGRVYRDTQLYNHFCQEGSRHINI